jgi:hypothetical protein
MKLAFSVDEVARLVALRAREILPAAGNDATVRWVYEPVDGREAVVSIDVEFSERIAPESATSDGNISGPTASRGDWQISDRERKW